MLYTTDRFCKLVGITKETLRHYVDIGLVTPDNVGSNNYNYYSEKNALDILYIRHYRGFGAPVSDIKKNMIQVSLEEQQKWIFDYESVLERELLEAELKLERIKKFKKRILSIQKRINTIWEESKADGPDIYRLLWIQKNCDLKSEAESVINRWLAFPQYIYVAFNIDKEQLMDKSCHLYTITMGIGINDEYVQSLNLPTNDSVKFHPADDNVQTIISVDDPFSLTREDLNPILTYIEENQYCIANDLSGRLLSCETKDNKKIYYLTIRISIKK